MTLVLKNLHFKVYEEKKVGKGAKDSIGLMEQKWISTNVIKVINHGQLCCLYTEEEKENELQ